MAAIAVHVVYNDVVTTSNRYAIVLVDDYAVADFSVVSGSKIETVTVMRGGKSIRTIIWCVAGTVVQRDVMDIKTSAVAHAEAMNRVVLNVDIVD